MPEPRPSNRGDFRGEIGRLAREAREESLEHHVKGIPIRQRRSRLRRLVWVGGSLVVLELAILGAQIGLRHRDLADRPSPRVLEIRNEETCRGEIFRTHPAIVAYLKKHGRPPARLEDLVGQELEVLPVDPQTAKPLVYETDGKRFRLSCPESILSK